MKRIVMLMLVAIGFAAQAQKPAVVADNEAGWKHIGQVTASFKTTSESIVVLGADEFQAIKLKVSEAPIHIERVQVFYESGQMEELDIKSELKEGAETRVINLSNPKRDISKVAFTYRTLPNSTGEKADVELYGLKNGTEGDASYLKDDVKDAKREAREESRELKQDAREAEREAREEGRELKQEAKEEGREMKREANDGMSKLEREANSVDVEKEAEVAEDAISEAAAKAAAAITDKKLEDKVGPDGQTVYVDDDTKYYYINQEGEKVFITKLQLKDKPDND
ncbi:MAG TPA: hypothetical protein VGD40_12965 [Chryseosolibacter sp.]